MSSDMPVQRWKPRMIFRLRVVARHSPWASIQGLSASSMMQPQVPTYQSLVSRPSSPFSNLMPNGTCRGRPSRMILPSVELAGGLRALRDTV